MVISIKNKKNVYLLLSFTFLVALFVRIQYVNNTIIPNPIKADARQYVIYGYNLSNYGVFSQEISAQKPAPDSFRSPGYPFLISLCFKLGGKDSYYPLIIYCQILISSFMVLITYYIASQFLTLKWAFITTFLIAFNPHLISMTSYVLTETLFSFTLLSAIFFFNKALNPLSLKFFIYSALFFGYSYLTNETALFIPYLLIFFLLLIGQKNNKEHVRKLFANSIVFIIVFSIFPVCWTIRNNCNIPSSSLKSSNRAIATLSHGTYPGFVYKNSQFKYFPYRDDPLNSVMISSYSKFREIVWERIKERPVRYMSWYLFEKPYFIWSWDNLQSQMGGNPGKGQGDIYVYPVITSLYHTSIILNLTRIIIKFLHPVFLISALSGIFFFSYHLIKRHNVEKLVFSMPFILYIIIIYYTLLYSIFAPWPRYSVPLRPELYLFAIWSFCELLKKEGIFLPITHWVRGKMPDAKMESWPTSYT